MRTAGVSSIRSDGVNAINSTVGDRSDRRRAKPNNPDGDGCAGSTPVERSVQGVYFFGGETLMSFVTLTTPSVSFASFSASDFASSVGTVPFR